MGLLASEFSLLISSEFNPHCVTHTCAKTEPNIEKCFCIVIYYLKELNLNFFVTESFHILRKTINFNIVNISIHDFDGGYDY